MNWGHGVSLGFIGFAGFILYLVFQSFNQTVDLVADDYYKQEIEYNSQMTRIRNANNLEGEIKLSQTNDQIKIQFPVGFINEVVNGQVELFRPSDASKDIKFLLEINDEGVQFLSKNSLIKGMYRIKINCSTNGKDYFFEEIVHV